MFFPFFLLEIGGKFLTDRNLVTQDYSISSTWDALLPLGHLPATRSVPGLQTITAGCPRPTRSKVGQRADAMPVVLVLQFYRQR